MPTKPEIDSHFDALTRSAFDFVERAISSFSDNERISLFLFATGLELFTKARLYHEHWSLIFANVDQAEFRRFETGVLKTVGADNAHERVKKIIGHSLPLSFEEIRKHRNRIAHFTHGITSEQRLEIVSHQLQGWFDLHHLLQNDWHPIFKRYKKRYKELERTMRRHSEFLDTKFKAVQLDLNKERELGHRVHICPACGHEAMVAQLLDGSIHRGNCLVCRRNDNYVLMPCMNDECEFPGGFFASDGAPDSCPECQDVYAENLTEALDTGPTSVDDHEFDPPINCPYCSGYHSVVHHHNGYVCTECFEYEDLVGYCGCCFEGQLGGVGEYSEISGCCICDGRPS